MGFRHTLLAALMVVAPPAMAQDNSTADQPQPCQSAPYRSFDFWIGDWIVTDPTGEVAGTNTITREEGGCLLVEHWTGSTGTTGMSFNYLNPVTGMWRQVWVSGSVIIDYDGGLNQRGQMILEGTINYRNGDSFDFRGTWTPNENGSVRQHLEQYNPEKKGWEDWFVGTYRKKR